MLYIELKWDDITTLKDVKICTNYFKYLQVTRTSQNDLIWEVLVTCK